MRFSFKRLSFAITFALVLLLGALELYSGVVRQQVNLALWPGNRFTASSFEKESRIVRKKVHYTNYVYSDYDDFLKAFGKRPAKAALAPLEEKCTQFFSQHAKKYPEWTFHTYQDLGQTYDKSIADKAGYFKKVSEQMIKERGEHAVLSRDDNNTIETMFQEEVAHSQNIANKMADTITLFRVFGKCFLDKDEKYLDEHNFRETYNLYAQKLFPFIAHAKLPRYRHVSSEEELTPNYIPVYNKDNTYTGETVNYNFTHSNQIEFYNRHKSGRGIVISASTRHARDLVKLIRVLRAMNNKLPIQVIYKSDLSKKLIDVIGKAATLGVDFLTDPGMAPEHTSVMPDLVLSEVYKDFGSEFPTQDLWFVNIANSITRDFKYKFPGFSNKLLAMLYSSFEEVILMDADTVPLIPVEDFFKLKEYQTTGTMFFKDRALRDHNDFVETNLFALFFPSVNEKSLDSLFGIPSVTEHTLGNKYMTGWRHFQEAGIVAFDKSKHFLGSLMTFPLCLWKEPVASSIWGDKEMYWLGLSMAGDENYAFNELSAASVGQVTERRDFKHYPNSKSREVCSTHPGHVYKDTGRLLWINSGFSFCKMNGYFRDRVHFPFEAFKLNEMSQLYTNPLKIKGAIVPPDLPRFREPGNPVDLDPELRFKESWKHRKQDVDDQVNGKRVVEVIEQFGPQKGWMKNPVCFGYMYCAYNSVASYADDTQTDDGYMVMFYEKDIKMYDYLGKFWITGNTRQTARTKPPKPPAEPPKEESKEEPKEPGKDATENDKSEQDNSKSEGNTNSNGGPDNSKSDGNTNSNGGQDNSKSEGNTNSNGGPDNSKSDGNTNSNGGQDNSKSEGNTNSNGGPDNSKSEGNTNSNGGQDNSKSEGNANSNGGPDNSKSEGNTNSNGGPDNSKSEGNTNSNGGQDNSKSEGNANSNGGPDNSKSEGNTNSNGGNDNSSNGDNSNKEDNSNKGEQNTSSGGQDTKNQESSNKIIEGDKPSDNESNKDGQALESAVPEKAPFNHEETVSPNSPSPNTPNNNEDNFPPPENVIPSIPSHRRPNIPEPSEPEAEIIRLTEEQLKEDIQLQKENKAGHEFISEIASAVNFIPGKKVPEPQEDMADTPDDKQ